MKTGSVVWVGVIGLAVGFIGCWILLPSAFGYKGPSDIADEVEAAQMEVHAAYCVLAATSDIADDVSDNILISLGEAGSSARDLREVVAQWADESGNSRWNRNVADFCAAQIVELHAAEIAAAVLAREESDAAAEDAAADEATDDETTDDETTDEEATTEGN